MMKSVKIFSFLVLISRNPPKKHNQNIIKGWKTLSEKNYSIQYPPLWELNQSGQMGLSFILLSPLENSTDQFRENVNLVIENLSGQNIDLVEYSKIAEGQMKTMLTNFKKLENNKIKINNNEYNRLVFTSDQGIFHLQCIQYYWIQTGNAYVVTFTSEQKSFEQFKKYGESILNSFCLE